jgi:hypothetical protein
MEEGEEDDFDEDDRFAVWPENWDSVQLFLACWNQWDMVPMTMTVSAGMGGSHTSTIVWYEGMNFTKLRDTMAMLKMKETPELLMDMRLMEAEAKVVRNRRANKGH